jgi:DNA invertase Pin-like site-specific DNA recombinase
MSESKRAVGYIRVSTSDQANSLEVQEKRIRDYCKFKKIELTEIFTDEDVSGGKPFYERKGGDAANSALIGGIDTIIAVKPDRMFRNVKDALITMDDWTENDISLHLVDMGGNSIDTKTAMGRMFFIQAISMAEFERRIAGERTKVILNNRKDSGKVYCHSLLGFDKVDGKLVKNEEEWDTIEYIKQYKYELSPAAIAEKLNANKFKAKKGGIFFPSTIQSILKNPIYG